MPTFRSFRNFDPPVLTDLWQSRAGQTGLLQPVSPDLFEQLLFAKLYFDYSGLFLACEDGQAIGYAHAGFGPNEQQSAISTDAGVTCAIVVRPDCDQRDVAAGLLEQCEQYLRRRGAKSLFGGGLYPVNPFYLGLYGGSELPGILDSDTTARDAFASAGYHEAERTTMLRCELNHFESVVDRRQMLVRRQMVVEVTSDAPTRTWWEACTLGEFDLTRFDLVPRIGGAPVATAAFRSMESTGSVSLGRAAGLMDLRVEESYRGRGLAIFLLSEAFRQFLRQGIMLVEAQTRQSNPVAMGLFQKLGFQKIEEGGVWKKDC